MKMLLGLNRFAQEKMNYMMDSIPHKSNNNSVSKQDDQFQNLGFLEI